MLPDDSHRVVAHEGRAPRHHLVEHGAQGVQVGAGRDLPAHGLLRRHVGYGAHHHALLGEPGPVRGDGEAEVADLGPSHPPSETRSQV